MELSYGRIKLSVGSTPSTELALDTLVMAKSAFARLVWSTGTVPLDSLATPWISYCSMLFTKLLLKITWGTATGLRRMHLIGF